MRLGPSIILHRPLFRRDALSHARDTFSEIIRPGERILIGPRGLFPESLIADSRFSASILQTQALHRVAMAGMPGWTAGLGRVVRAVIGWFNSPTAQELYDRAVKLLRAGEIHVVILPVPPRPTAADAISGLQRAGEALSAGTAALPAMPGMPPTVRVVRAGVTFGSDFVSIDTNNTTMSDLDTLSARLAYMIKRSPHFMRKHAEGQLNDILAIVEFLKKPAVLIGIVAVLAIWVGLHFFGVGFIMDAVLLGLCFLMMGWVAFEIGYLLGKACRTAYDATTMAEMDESADLFAQALVKAGFELLLAFATWGVSKLATGIRKGTQAARRAMRNRRAAGGRGRGSAADDAVPVRPTAAQRMSDQIDDVVKTGKTRSADEINASYPDGYEPPYTPGTQATEFAADGNIEFVRVYGKNNPKGGWVMKESDISGLTPAQIQDKFALPEPPTDFIRVVPPAGTSMRTGTVNPNFGGAGGAQQFEFLERVNDGWGATSPLPGPG